MVTIEQVLTFLDQQGISYQFKGNKSELIEGFSSLTNYKERTMTWVKIEENIPENFDLDIVSLAVVQQGIDVKTCNIIYAKESKTAFFSILEHFFSQPLDRNPVGQNCYVSESVKIGQNVKIGHNCTLDGDITIGDNTIIWDNVTILNRVEIGRHCIIQSGTRIGHDGYGYYEDADHVKTMVKHYGGVEIGDDVFIGPNCVIDRGTIDNTVIAAGAKIDGMCFLAHNAQLGQNVAVVAGSVVLGSAIIEKNSYISTSVLKNQITVKDEAFVGMGSVVIKDVPEGTVVVGNPARVLRMEK